MLEMSSHSELAPFTIQEASYPSLRGKTVLITGGASGIGMYMVQAFCTQGAEVHFLDINAGEGKRVSEIVAQLTGARPSFLQVDLINIAELRGAIASIERNSGAITALINNAANDDRHELADIEPDYWDQRMNVNLRHQFFAAQAVLPGMQKAGGGTIINMGSISWMVHCDNMICYTTAKSAVEGLTRTLSRECGVHNIRVNSIVPGWVMTDRQVSRQKKIDARALLEFKNRQSLKSYLLPDDIARMALWLTADDSRMVTGQTMIVDGGVV